MEKEATVMLISNRARRTGITGVLLGSVWVLMFLIVSCGGDDPTTPGGEPPPRPDDQLPVIPVMTDPNTEPPTRSELISVVKPIRDYAPWFTAAFTPLNITSMGRFEEWPLWTDCFGFPQSEYAGAAWTNGGIPPIMGCIDACGFIPDFCETNSNYPEDGFDANMSRLPKEARCVLWKDGQKVPSPGEVTFAKPSTEYCVAYHLLNPNLCVTKLHLYFGYKAEPLALTNTPYLRRDRLWVAQKWESGALVHQIQGENETRMKTLWMSGCDSTQIRSFAYSVGATVGAQGSVLSAAIEASISRTFTTEVTVRAATETSVEKVLAGKEGKLTCHMYWALVDRYSFANVDGTDFADPNYIFEEGYYDPVLGTYFDFEMVGVIAERVVTYEFDLATGAFVAVAEHPVQ